MDIGWCMDVFNHYIAHPKLVQHCMLTILESKLKKKKDGGDGQKEVKGSGSYKLKVVE